MTNKVKASPEGQKIIETARTEKGRGTGWAKEDCHQALTDASLYQLQNVILPALEISVKDNPNPTLNLKKLKAIIDKNCIKPPINEYSKSTLIFFTDDSQEKILTIINQLVSKNYTDLHLNDFYKFFDKYKLRLDRITDRNWRDFLSGKLIDEDIFTAFCSILGISWQEVIAQETPFEYKDSTNTTLLVEVLNTFNHKEQKDLVCSNLALSHAPKAFLVINPCSYRRTWMLRRIEYEIKTFGKEVQPEDFFSKSQYTSLSIKDLKSRFNQKYPDQSLNEVLKSKYIFLIINVDNYNFNNFKDLINEFWKPILARVNPEKPGKILMFMISSDQGNDWQTEWKNCDMLKDAIAELTPANSFKAQDLIEILPRIALKFDITLTEDPATLSQSILEKGQGRTEEIIKALYQQFNCKHQDLIRQWQTYPPR
ncbi:hypothetical protein [Planktothrix paucivesiculata]|uniref:Inactive STAND domain-containing protein n=1 Tax=Planktothrix paucivesiculata PCC 9631 TaxID=671071 RepID=A0A7Z9BYM1_9CYAN|nr:hypothetical protein [Planktothrix paucivesiculata]VXD25191.1 hypothetical protein PL9631_940023 [Planktothrix paucivesiculata PCC 9631]